MTTTNRENRMNELYVSHDTNHDVLTIEGIAYAGEVFRQLGGMLPVGATFQLRSRADDVITIVTEGIGGA